MEPLNRLKVFLYLLNSWIYNMGNNGKNAKFSTIQSAYCLSRRHFWLRRRIFLVSISFLQLLFYSIWAESITSDRSFFLMFFFQNNLHCHTHLIIFPNSILLSLGTMFTFDIKSNILFLTTENNLWSRECSNVVFTFLCSYNIDLIPILQFHILSAPAMRSCKKQTLHKIRTADILHSDSGTKP